MFLWKGHNFISLVFCYYNILSQRETSSSLQSASKQVAIAYNNKVEELKNEGLEEDELNKKLELLKVSKQCVCN